MDSLDHPLMICQLRNFAGRLSMSEEGDRGGRGIDPVSRFALSYISGNLAMRADAVHFLVEAFGFAAPIFGIFIFGRKSKSYPLRPLQNSSLNSALSVS